MRRGEVYELRLPKGVGHERYGRRFGVVVQADEMLPRSIVLIAPTSTSARPASFRPQVAVGRERARVMVEQLGAVDVSRLGKRVRQLDPEEQWAVDDAIATVHGLH